MAEGVYEGYRSLVAPMATPAREAVGIAPEVFRSRYYTISQK